MVQNCIQDLLDQQGRTRTELRQYLGKKGIKTSRQRIGAWCINANQPEDGECRRAIAVFLKKAVSKVFFVV
jgi:hypothetical protein